MFWIIAVSAWEDLVSTVRRLRSPGGCPWDREQTHQTLCRCLIEECCELLDTIDRGDLSHMKEELGDVLLQVVLHAQIAVEEGAFSIDDVARTITEKLIRRHPHVFGSVDLETSSEVLVQWEAIKEEEKRSHGHNSASWLERLPPLLPALLFARDICKHLAKANPAIVAPNLDSPVLGGARDGLLDEEEVGRRLHELVAWCYQQGIDPESALRRYSRNLAEESVRGMNLSAQQST